jgi:hypothetical protein
VNSLAECRRALKKFVHGNANDRSRSCEYAAVMQAYKIGENVISYDLISSLLKADLNNIDAVVLARNRYQQMNAVAELLGATQKEAKDFLSGKLSGNKRQEYLNILNGIGLNFEKTV